MRFSSPLPVAFICSFTFKRNGEREGGEAAPGSASRPLQAPLALLLSPKRSRGVLERSPGVPGGCPGRFRVDPGRVLGSPGVVPGRIPGVSGGILREESASPVEGGWVTGGSAKPWERGCAGRTSSAPPIWHLHACPWPRVPPRPPGVSPSPKPFPPAVEPGPSPPRAAAPDGAHRDPPAARLCPWGGRGCAQERGHAAPAWRCARVGVRVHACARTSRGHTPLGNRTYLGNKSVGTRLCCAAPGRSAGGNCRAPPGAGVGAGTGAVTPGPDPPRGLSPAWKFSGEPPPEGKLRAQRAGEGRSGRSRRLLSSCSFPP